MTEPAPLDRRYRRLLGWHPQPFRSEHEDEMPAVLLASARAGQRRPGPLEAADVIRSALGMRLRRLGQSPQSRGWTDALAVFSLAAPLFLLLVSMLEVGLPYRLHAGSRPAFPVQLLSQDSVGGLSLLGHQAFEIALGGQVIIAALVLLGLRRTALTAIAAVAAYWAVTRYGIPDPLKVLSIVVYLPTAAA